MKTISRYIMTLALLLTAVTGAWAAAAYYVVGNFTDWSTNPAYKMTLNTECTSTTEYMLTLDLPANAQFKVVKDDGQGQTWYPDGMGNAYGENGELPGAGKYTVYFRPNGDGNPDWFYSVMYVAAAPGTVTLNDTKTEASFVMPTFDVDVNYELVRDITQQVDLEVRIDGTASTRIRIAKDNDGHYQFVTEQGWQFAAIDKLDNNKDLTNGELTYSFKKKEGDEYVGKPELSPGIWRLEATANDDKPYDGTIYGTDIELYEGYEVTVGAGEYATFYKDEAVRVNEADKENFKLYTVSSVSGDKATLSNAFDAAPSNTPFLVYNNTNESKTVLLIPCNEPDLALTVADQFQGTMEEKTFTDADMAAADYYVCNGKQFVKVRGAGTLGANKAYLKFVTDQQLSAPQYISISGDLGEGTTRIDNLNVNDNENGEWYDLNGRKLNGKPAQKGIYIKNGKKIVVK